ncbi:MAG: hypothetical protein AAFX90_18070 [Pseudomonadota bacterium]
MVQALQEAIAHKLISELPDEFDRAEVNIEIDTIDGDLVLSPDGDVHIGGQSEQIRLGINLRGLFKELRFEMAAAQPNTRPWTICDLLVDNTGAFKFRFSYETPPRLAKLAG